MPADWVATTCRLPLVYQSGEKSSRQHFEPARVHLNDRNAFFAAVRSWLGKHPDLIDAWKHYPEDKRTIGAYLDLKSLEVGAYEVSSGYSDVRMHADAADACADFIYREAVRVLK